eukprot:COSAG05_NODE_20109_length_283_cov_0.554348_1_plen_37_part_10
MMESRARSSDVCGPGLGQGQGQGYSSGIFLSAFALTI